MKIIEKINIVAVFIVVICIVMILEMRLPREVKEVVSNGVIASVEEVGLNGDKVTVKVSLQKEDGKSFEEDTRIGEVEIKAAKGGVSYHTKPNISKDNKVISYTFEISKGEEINMFYGYTLSTFVNEDEEVSQEIDEDYFAITKTGKIKVLKPVIRYILKEVIDESEWQLKVNLKKAV